MAMNKQKKEGIIAQLSKTCAMRGIDMKHFHMMMGDKGYNDQDVREILNDAGLTLSQNEFTEIYGEIKAAIDQNMREAREKKAEEERPPSFDEASKGTNVISNDKDLLTRIQSSPLDDQSNAMQQSSSLTVAASQDEPPSEEVQLPSMGRFYTGILAEKKGKILIRPMTLREEKVLSTERLVKTGQAFDMIFRQCIKTPGIDTTQLLSSDRVFVLFYLRAISYGPEYEVKVMCTSCGKENITTLNIAELDITHPPSELDEPYAVTLPASKKVMRFKLARGQDETRMIRSINAPKRADEVNNIFQDRIMSLLVEVEGVPKEKWPSTINNLIGRDLSHLRKTLQLVDFGYKANKRIECSSCGAVLEADLTINENFFRSE